MKVVLLAPSKSSHTHKWALFYKNQGIDVTVITFKEHFSPENAKEVRTIALPKLLPGKLSYLSSVVNIRKLLKQNKPDIVHAHFVSSYGFIGALTHFHPLFVSVWGTDIFKFPKRNALNKAIVKYSLEKADAVCSTSSIMAKETTLYCDKDIKITPFGVDLGLFYPKPKVKREKYQIGIVKGLEDVYGFKDLFKAFQLLYTNEAFPNIELTIVGDGSKLTEYKEICGSLGISEGVNFIGRVPNREVPNYLREMDVVVLPSIEESFGVSAVEAMACGVPVVVSDADGLKEVVVDGKTGFIVPKGNPNKLAESVEELLLDNHLRASMGNKGIEHVKTYYDWEENANRMIRYYRETLNRFK